MGVPDRERLSPRSIEIQGIDQHHDHTRLQTLHDFGYLSCRVLRAPVIDCPHSRRICKVQIDDHRVKILLQHVHISVSDAEIIIHPHRVGRLHYHSVIASQVYCLEKTSVESIVELYTCFTLSTLSYH